jgi:multiple sugar transport system substrate-binding protein
MQNIFIKAQRWMRAGWETPLDDYIAKSKYDVSDFIPALVSAHNWEGKQYALPYLAESTQMIYRKDVLDGAGLKPPENFDDLGNVLAKIHKPPDFFGYVMRTQKAGVHFPFPVWLQGYGGNVFRDPPKDVTPALNTDAAIKAATNFTDLVLKYSIAGAQIYDTPDCQNAIIQGKAGVWVDALGLFANLRDPAKSKFADQMAIYLPPAGPAGRFPQIATHGYMIPKGSKNKDAAWEFIAWALSKDMMLKAAVEGGYSAISRKSTLTAPDYAKKYTIAGVNVGDLVNKALETAKPAYRVLPEFPQVGERIGQAIAEILSKQKSVKDALDAAQKDAEKIMTDAGYKISP